MKKILIYFGLFLILTANTAYAANITVSTSRNPVSLDDSFHLIYEADSSVDGDPDFSPIYNDFEILSSSQSTNMRSVNGSWSLKKTWDLAVIAKDVGKFMIPPIKFGRDISPSIQITILNSSSPNSVAPNGQASIPAKIFLESSIDNNTGFVQSQFIYTVRLLRTVTLVGASLSEPVVTDPDAIIKKISEDSYQTTRQGIRYEVFERKYAIFPQKSGRLKVQPLTFEGRINATQPRSIFDQFRQSGQLKRIRAKAVEFTVKPAPSSVKLQDWLPAANLQLIEEWSDDLQNIKTGEPITRTITITAEGLTGIQLADIKFDDIDGIKQYPDKAVIEDLPDTTGITGSKQIKVALIPTHAGHYTLPEIHLNWWNTQTNKIETAIIPESPINVSGTAEEIAPVTPVTEKSAPTVTTNSKTRPQPSTSPTSNTEETLPWKWLSLLFAAAWLLTLIAYFRKPTAVVSENTIVKKSATNLKKVVSDVKKYAQQGNKTKTRDALIVWAREFYDNPDITNIGQIANTCSDALAKEISRLNTSMYGNTRKDWHGSSLVMALDLENSTQNQTGTNAESALKPLYETK